MGWNGSGNKSAEKVTPARKPPAKAPRSLVRGIVAGALVVLASVIVLLFMFSGPKSSKRTSKGNKVKQTAAPREVKPSLPTQKIVDEAPKPSTDDTTSTSNVTDREQMLWHGQKAVSWETKTNKFKIVETVVTADGKRHRLLSDPPGISEFGTDQLIAMALQSADGRSAPMPGLSGKSLDAQFKESLKTPIVINEDDSPQLKKIKQDVIAAREDMAAMIADGRSVAEVLQESVKVNKENADTRNSCLKEYREILKSGDIDSAKKYLLKINIALQQMGIKEIPESGRDRDSSDRNPVE